MALKKSENIAKSDVRTFKEFEEAKAVFIDESKSIDDRLAALDYIIRHKEIYFVLRMLSELFNKNDLKDHPLIDFAFAGFDVKPKREEDFNEMFKMLNSENAYLRNKAIQFIQEYGVESKPFLEKLMNSEDRDIRIFAINILGDVSYDDSIEMLRYFILKEKDINPMMTAVDYLGEIGSENDIPLLEAIKEDYKDEPYVTFGIDMAIERLKA